MSIVKRYTIDKTSGTFDTEITPFQGTIVAIDETNGVTGSYRCNTSTIAILATASGGSNMALSKDTATSINLYFATVGTETHLIVQNTTAADVTLRLEVETHID